MISEEELIKIINEINFTTVKSALVILNEIVAKCNSFDEFKICLNATANNLTNKQ